jgi:hypothetical protein
LGDAAPRTAKDDAGDDDEEEAPPLEA